jgi:hypothetical protein
MATRTQFECDECQRQTTTESDGADLPIGWIESSLDGVNDDGDLEMVSYHFCSWRCLEAFAQRDRS